MAKIFLHHKGSLNQKYPIDNRHEDLRNYLIKLFTRNKSSKGLANYYILDQYLDPMKDIFEPITSGEIEQSFICDLISTLAMFYEQIDFSIITRADVRGLAKALGVDRSNVPSVDFKHNDPNSCLIKSCRYNSKNMTCPHDLHDRWLLCETDRKVVGIHMGPSFQDINGKDVTVTLFSRTSCDTAISRFKDIWHICEQKRD